MADMMTFPDTVEEFMEEYKLVDTEQVYTNGTELVPIFRMKQWFEHEKAQHFKEGTTSDLISRQAAIDALDCINGTEEVLRSLPPAQPERAEGEWELKDHMWECNKCGCRINVKSPLCENVWNYYFCPHCGTKMTIAVQRF